MSDDSAADKRERILEAALAVLGRDGISGVTMRAVAREADVALGLATYHFEDKAGLVVAALERIADGDAALVEPDPADTPPEALRAALHRIADPTFLSLPYLSLRLQLWSLAGVDERYASINQHAQRRYLDGLVALLGAARPDLDPDEVERRANDILVVQNGVWLTSVLVPDPATVARSVARTETIAFADATGT
ncbi:MAG: TetR/AcrR family transcriptional regulator [Actinomycetota bacterium]